VILTLDIENASTYPHLPQPEQVECWVKTALTPHLHEAEVSIRYIDIAEMTKMNLYYRHKHGPTNVLSFPTDIPKEWGIPLLGDLVICPIVLEHEANQNHKDFIAHFAHIVIHGTLHLLGFDHIDDTCAKEMESLEMQLMASLGYPNPYGEQ